MFSNEKIKTAQVSAAKFVFSDNMNSGVGASAQLTLDGYVYNSETSYAKAAANFAAGTFRFTTGGSDKGAYQLKIVTALIGVRGTQFDLSVHDGDIKLILLQGEVAICLRSRFHGDPRRLSKALLRAYHGLNLTRSDETAQLSRKTASLSASPVDFACAGAAGLCSTSVPSAAESKPALTALDPSDSALCYASQD